MSLTTNLVSYWKLDETSGNAADSVGSNTLTNNGTSTYSSALINNGINLGDNNTTKSLSAVNNLGIDGGTISVSIWIKRLTGATNGKVFFCQGNSNSKVGYLLRDTGSGTLWVSRFRTGTAEDGAIIGTTTSVISSSIFTHIVLTYDGTNVRGYLNGTLTNTTASSGGASTALPNVFGLGQDFSATAFASVIIDEVGVWNRALTSTEISTLYNGGAGLQYPFILPNKSNFLMFM